MAILCLHRVHSLPILGFHLHFLGTPLFPTPLSRHSSSLCSSQGAKPKCHIGRSNLVLSLFSFPSQARNQRGPLRHFPRLQLLLLLLLTITTVLVIKLCQKSSSQVNCASLLKGRIASVFDVDCTFFLRIHSHSHPHTLTHSLEELISFCMLSPYVPLPSSGQLLERKRLSPQRDPRMVGVGGWGGEGGKRKSC